MPDNKDKRPVTSSLVLVYSENPIVLKTLNTIFEFIDVNFLGVDSLTSLNNILSRNHEILLTLVHMEDTQKLDKIFELLKCTLPAAPLYQLSQENQQYNSILPSGISGILKFPMKYQQLLSVVKDAKTDKKNNPVHKKLPTLVGSSPQMREIQSLIQHVSKTDANVLILGESGTGKEVVARSIHSLSLRNNQSFVAVNCGAIPHDLLESELFGHEKGAFTGAINMRKGRFELAEGGTLFLDEIGDMPYEMQIKLLRVIQEKTFERVGGSKCITSNVRIIAATHQDLEKKISEGKFRMDLYYRLNVFPIELEPLRNRPIDIEFLINEFSTKMEVEYNSPIIFEDSALQVLKNHRLPGNVRELENLVERLAILFPGEVITSAKLPARYQSNQNLDVIGDSETNTVTVAPSEPELNNVKNLKQYLTTMEKSIIENALNESNGIVAKAAKSLSLQRTTLVEKIRKLDIHQSA